MRSSTRWAIALGALLGFPSLTQAHFLWVVSATGERAEKVNVYFSESASPDDPDLLDGVLTAEAWAAGSGRDEPAPLELSKEEDALVATVPEKYQGSPIGLRHTYGVISRGGETFLLQYYAKTYPSTLPGTWRAMESEKLPLEITPNLDGSKLVLAIAWQGKPLAGAEVTVEGPGLEEPFVATTGDAGTVELAVSEAGLFSIRAKHTQSDSGEHEAKSYGSVRHYSTLALHVTPAQVKSASHQWAPLPKGTTSFGGAVAGDFLYVYGGHFGQAHHYSREGQSGEFQRLNLKNPSQWEPLPGGPKLTGLAMVAHDGNLYRIGGFTADNGDSEEEKLESQPDVARFDPLSGQWTSLPPLPEGRSSHDAAVIGDTLYVAGGWNMQPGEKPHWHDTAWSLDLSKSDPTWQSVTKPPFQRRALTLAAWQGRLYCLGGMQQAGGPTTAAAVYDPATQTWSDAPSLLGTSMDGFGASSFATADALYVTTMSGSIQRLSDPTGKWEFVGQLQQPRFFHRLLPVTDGELLTVGGADMGVGKILELERIVVRE